MDLYVPNTGERETDVKQLNKAGFQRWDPRQEQVALREKLQDHLQQSGTEETDVCQGLNSHYFHIIGDGHQPNSRGLYTHYKDSLLKVG